METEEIIWHISNKMRGTSRYDLFSFAEIAKSEGLDVNLDLLRLANKKFGVRGGIDFVPEFVLNFIISYLKESLVEKMLDPCVKIGSMIIPLTEKLKPKSSVGFISDKSKINVINLLQKDLDIQWELDDIENILDGKSKFDVIFSFPMWNFRHNTLEFNLDNGEQILISDHEEKLQMLKSLILLKEGGTGFFILNKGFLSIKSKKNNVFANLKKFGIFIDAALEIPSGSFTSTNMSGYLIIFKKEEPKNLFVGELSFETSSNDSLLKNLKLRKNGKIPQLGSLQDLKSFKSLSYLINENEINKMAKMSGMNQIPLTEMLIDINMGRSDKDFEDIPNSVYLPKIGFSNAITSLDMLKIKSQNYVQLVFDPNKDDADFIAGLYNTKFGKKIRESMLSGVTIPKITKTSLLNSNFYKTDIETQQNTVNVDSMLKEIFTQLDLYHNKLWKWPKANKEIRKSVELLNVGRKFDYWVGSLPFPLSSILSACKADSDVEHKVIYLLDFFEAYSMFNSIIILSSITSNEGFYKKYFMHCIGTSTEENNWLCRVNFTNWNEFGSCLARKVRQLISNNETKELCLKLFGNPTKEFMDLITSTDIYNVLKEVENYRNLWKGHGSRVNIEEYNNRFIILNRFLTKIRNKVSFTYDDVSLILPGFMEWDGQTYNGFCKEIKGFIPFETIEIETINPLIKNNLYLLHENQYEAVKLLPFIRIMPGPKTERNACYFYNRYDLQENSARYLSYHFEDDAEVNILDNDLKSAFSIIMPKNEY